MNWFKKPNSIIISVVFIYLVKPTKQTESFKIYRGEYDMFSNPVCLGNNQRCTETCSQFEAVCTDKECLTCVCKNGSRNTFQPRDGVWEKGKCVKDKDIVHESVGTGKSFQIRMTQNEDVCAATTTDSNFLQFSSCNSSSLEQKWIWTSNKRLMNIGSLKCIENLQRSDRRVALKQCSIARRKRQRFLCESRDNMYAFKQKSVGSLQYLQTFKRDDVRHLVLRRISNLWRNYVFQSGGNEVCGSPADYKGCYRFNDGSFMQLLNETTCNNSCYSKPISAPIYIENYNCTLNWDESQYLGEHDGMWYSVDSKSNYFTLEKVQIGLDKKGMLRLKIVNRDVFQTWNGAILKLEVNCKGLNKKRRHEEHCVIFKIGNTEVKSRLDQNIEPSSSKKAVILISTLLVAIVVTVLLVIVGIIMFYKRWKSCHNSQSDTTETGIYEEPKRDNQGEVDTNKDYQGLVGIYPANVPECTAVYEYIDNNDVNVPVSNDNEYSYVSNGDAMPQPSDTTLYHTLEEPMSGIEQKQSSENVIDQIMTPVYAVLEGNEDQKIKGNKTSSEMLDRCSDEVGDSVCYEIDV